VAATASFTRRFVSDRQLLQRERKASSGPITALAYGAVVAIALALLVLLAWGLHRVAVAAAPSGGGGRSHPGCRRPRVAVGRPATSAGAGALRAKG